MKIAYISSHAVIPSKGANSIHIMKMCAAYAKLGHEVSLFVSSNKESSIEGAEEVFHLYGVTPNFTITRVPLFRHPVLSFFSMCFLLPVKVLAKKPDVVHSRNILSAWAMACIFRTPVIIELHNMPHRGWVSMLIFRSLIRSRFCKFIISITHALKNEVGTLISRKPVIMVAPDGVEEKSLSLEVDKVAFRKKLDIDSNSMLAVYTGHLYEGRGISLLIDLAKRLPSYYFLIVGGTEKEVAHYRILTNGMSNICFTGFVSPSEVPKFQHAADVLLMPYEETVRVAGSNKSANTAQYASPLKMFEYMSAKAPIVSSDLPVLKEILTHGKNAFLIPYNDTDAWVDVLESLARNPAVRKSVAEQAFSDVSQYTWEERAKNIIAFYNS